MATTPTRSSGAPDPGSTASPAAPGLDAAAPSTGAQALATPAQIMELAEHLSACADQLHERIMRDIRAYAGGPVPEHVQAAARALFDDEVLLRQRANGLHADAATYIVKGLGKQQAHLVKLTTDAAEKIRKIGVIGEAAGLVGSLLALAGAAATGQPVAILAAIDKVQKHGKALDALKPKAKPPAKAG